MENAKFANSEAIGIVKAKSQTEQSVLLGELNGEEHWYRIYDVNNPYFTNLEIGHEVKIIYNVKVGRNPEIQFRNIYRIYKIRKTKVHD